jgi:hypothetical protein
LSARFVTSARSPFLLISSPDGCLPTSTVPICFGGFAIRRPPRQCGQSKMTLRGLRRADRLTSQRYGGEVAQCLIQNRNELGRRYLFFYFCSSSSSIQ